MRRGGSSSSASTRRGRDRPPTIGWWGDGPAPWERWPGVSLQLDARWSAERSRWESLDGQYWFDAASAARPSAFMHRYLKLTKGSGAGKPVELLPWQEWLLVRPLFGWRRVSDGRRRFRRCFVFVPKKNGKSTLCAALGLSLAFADGEPGAEVYSASGDEKQARIVWGDSAAMAEQSPEFLEDSGVQVLANSIVQPHSNSSYQPLTAKAASKHGFNVHGLVFDELHAQKSRALYDTLRRGISARTQPVILVITTAGDDRESICYEEYQDAKRIRDGVFRDDTVLPVIFEPAVGADWTDVATWHACNPSLGVAKSLDYMREECEAARREPRKRNDFLRLELNVWTESRSVWITPEAWADCRRSGPEPSDLAELPCVLGFDLSETVDLTCVAALWRRPDGPGSRRPADRMALGPATSDVADATPGVAGDPEPAVLAVDFSVYVRTWFFMPKAILEARVRERRDAVPWDVWARDGWIRATPGEIIDYSAIRHLVARELIPRWKPREAGFDPYNSRQLMPVLQDDGLPVVEVRQGFLTLSAPCKLFEGLVASRRIEHDGNPVMAWCVSNCEVATDAAGNIKPQKPGGDARSSRRIDGVSATVTGLARLMVLPLRSGSPYARRGVRAV